MEQIKPKLRPEKDIMDVSPKAEAGDQFFVQQAESQQQNFPNLKPEPRPDNEKRAEIISREYDGIELPIIKFKDGEEIIFEDALNKISERGTANEPVVGQSTQRQILSFLREENPTKQEFETYWYNQRLYEGGFITKDDGMKGRSEEDKEIADNKEQVDIAEADRNADGYVSPAEREVQLALQKNELVDEDEMNLYHGGMPCGCDDCQEEAGMMSYDEVSGNPIPLGSTAENVRDDIDANLSSGEYVLPAHVVKYHGLKHIMEMQSEAEMGLMAMHMDGLIQYVEDEGEPHSEDLEDTEVQASDDPEQEEAEAEAEASEEIPSEEMDVEVDTVVVDDHLDDDGDMEVSPVSKPLPAFVKKQKYAFAV